MGCASADSAKIENRDRKRKLKVKLSGAALVGGTCNCQCYDTRQQVEFRVRRQEFQSSAPSAWLPKYLHVQMYARKNVTPTATPTSSLPHSGEKLGYFWMTTVHYNG